MFGEQVVESDKVSMQRLLADEVGVAAIVVVANVVQPRGVFRVFFARGHDGTIREADLG